MLKFFVYLFRVLIPLIILGAGYFIFQYLMATGPEPKKRPPVDRTPTVEVFSAQQQDYTVQIDTSGIVKAQSENNLVTEVAGKIKKLSPNFRKGAYFKKGELLLQLDEVDTQDAIKIAKTNIAGNQASIDQLDQEEKNLKNTLKLTEINLRTVQKNLTIARENKNNVKRNRQAIMRNIDLINKNTGFTRKNLALAKRNLTLGKQELERVTSLWRQRLIARTNFDSEQQKMVQLEQAIVQQEQALVQQEQQRAQQEQSLIQQDQNILSQEQQILQQEQAVNQQLQSIENLKGQLSTFKSRRAGLKAKIETTRTQLKQQQRNLGRTSIYAPFSGRIQDTRVGLGQYVSPNSVLGVIYPVDFVEVEMPLSLTQYDLLGLSESINQNASKAGIHKVKFSTPFDSSKQLEGYISGTRATLDNQSRQITVVARIDKPFEQSKNGAILKIGQYLNASIKGKTYHKVYVLPPSAVRQNREILLFDKGQVKITPIKTIWNTEDETVVSSVDNLNHRKVISTPLPQASDGMKIALPGEKKSRKQKDKGKDD